MIEKSKPIVSKKIRKSARDEVCSLRISSRCDYNQTTVLCHIGKDRGTAIKCHDTFAVYGCYWCHAEIDTKSKADYSADKLRALEETQSKMIQKGIIKVR